jgi:hypothetical protein
LDSLAIPGLKVESVRYIDTDMPGMCGEVRISGAGSPLEGLKRVRKGQKTTIDLESVVAFSVDRMDYVFFEREGRLDACVAWSGNGERLRFEYLVADSK